MALRSAAARAGVLTMAGDGRALSRQKSQPLRRHPATANSQQANSQGQANSPSRKASAKR